jgi:hypothetical protein
MRVRTLNAHALTTMMMRGSTTSVKLPTMRRVRKMVVSCVRLPSIETDTTADTSGRATSAQRSAPHVQLLQAVVVDAALRLPKRRHAVLDKGDVEQRDVRVDELEHRNLGDQAVLIRGVRAVVLCAAQHRPVMVTGTATQHTTLRDGNAHPSHSACTPFRCKPCS